MISATLLLLPGLGLALSECKQWRSSHIELSQVTFIDKGKVREHRGTSNVISAVLNLFRVADHLTNFVSVRGPPKMSTFSEFLTTFLVIFLLNFFSVTLGGTDAKYWGTDAWAVPSPTPNFGGTVPRTTKKNFPNFPNFLAFLRVKDRKKHSIFICKL